MELLFGLGLTIAAGWAHALFRFPLELSPRVLILGVALVLLLGGLFRRLPSRRAWVLTVEAVLVAAGWSWLYAKVPQRIEVYGNAEHYVRMLREGLWADEVKPFCLRALGPMLAGRWNLFPVRDLAALMSLNFAALTGTAYFLMRALERLRVPFLLRLLVPYFFLRSWMGEYAAVDQYLTDPLAYFFYALLVWSLTAERGYRGGIWALGVGLFASEKVMYWLPVLAFAAYFDLRSLRETVRAMAPAALGLGWIAFRALGTHAGPNRWEHAHWQMMLEGHPQLYLPFRGLEYLAIFGALLVRPWPLCLSLIVALPVALQVLVATDLDRMVAYQFFWTLPFAVLYLAHIRDRVLQKTVTRGPLVAEILGGAAVLLLVAAPHWISRSAWIALMVGGALLLEPAPGGLGRFQKR